MLSRCLPPQNRPHIETFDNPDLFPRIDLPIISTCLPFVALLFPSCLSDLSDVVPHLPPSCLALVLQIWSFPRLRVSSRCAFPILSQLFSTLPHNAQLSARLSPPIISHSFSLAFQLFPSYLPDVVSQLSPRCLPGAVAKMLSPSCFQGFYTCGESSSCRQDVVSQLSSTCGFPAVVSQLFPTLLHLLSSLPPVSQMWCPSCLPHVVS